MKWTDEKITETILGLAKELKIKRMPTSQEMRDNRLSGLSRAIGLRGGMKYWSEKTNLPMKKRKSKWTEQAIESELKKCIEVLCIQRMPTTNELQSIGRNDLHCAISKKSTYREWAKRLGLKLKSSDTTRGLKYEKIASEILISKGHEVKFMRTQHPFDLLVNDNVKIDVKMGVAHKHFGSRAHTFRPSSNHSTCDIYICFAIDEEGEVENIFIIPSKFAKVQTLNIGINSKYDKFIDRWDYINSYTEFYSSVTF